MKQNEVFIEGIKIRRGRLLFMTIGLLLGILIGRPYATPAPASLASPKTADSNRPADKEAAPPIEAIREIQQSIASLKDDLKAKEKARRSAKTDAEKTTLDNEISELNTRLTLLQSDFERLATGVDPVAFETGFQVEFNWKTELQDLLSPLMQELKSMTERPRQMEKLKREIDFNQGRLAAIQKALDNIDMLIQLAGQKELVQSLQKIRQPWDIKAQQTRNRQEVLRHQLAELEREDVSVFKSTGSLLRGFFRNRGKNLFFSFLAALVVYVVLRLGHRLLYRFSPWHRRKKRPFFVRVSDLVLYFVTAVGAILAMLIVLYVSGDWVLLIIVIIFLMGIAWTARQGLLRFWEQIQLILNFGACRENERVMYNGVPWLVESINVYTYLKNPELKGGRLRLPLRQLAQLMSRPHEAAEPWFPCKLNDWVLLGDGTHGRVTLQTPEMIQVTLLGGSRKTYALSGFLDQNPENLSTNFRIRGVFGVDYQHQAICTTEIPRLLKQALEERLREQGFADAVLNLKVEFREAGASSLDMGIYLDLSGKVAGDYFKLRRLMQKSCVEACNLHGWVIPFTQVTLHAADDASSKAADTAKVQAPKDASGP